MSSGVDTPSTQHSIDPETVKAIKHEIDEAQAGIARTYDAIYKSYGVILPIVTAILAFAAKDLQIHDARTPIAGTVFVIVVCLSGLWSQVMWMDLLRYARFKYVVLMPRFYRATNQPEARSYMDWTSGVSVRFWIPIHLFQVGCLAILVVTHVTLIAGCDRPWLELLSLTFVVALVISTVAVILEGAAVVRQIRSVATEGG